MNTTQIILIYASIITSMMVVYFLIKQIVIRTLGVFQAWVESLFKNYDEVGDLQGKCLENLNKSVNNLNNRMSEIEGDNDSLKEEIKEIKSFLVMD